MEWDDDNSSVEGMFVPGHSETKADRMADIGNSSPSDPTSGIHNRGRSRFVSRRRSLSSLSMV